VNCQQCNTKMEHYSFFPEEGPLEYISKWICPRCTLGVPPSYRKIKSYLQE